MRRFLDYFLAVTRHWIAVLATVTSSFIMSLPGWIPAFLPPDKAAKFTQTFAVSPTIAWWIAGTIFLIGFIYASFLAWNEERNELEKKVLEITQLKGDVPKLSGQFKGMEWRPIKDTKVGELFIDLEIYNRGAPTALCNWQAVIGRARPAPRHFLAVGAISEMTK